MDEWGLLMREEITMRRAFVAPPGWVWCSLDYAS
jgi:hypothetical protein